MQSNNPVFNRSEAFSGRGVAPATQTAGMTAAELQDLYRQPSAGPVETGRMTYDDVVMRTAAVFALVLVGAGIGWFVAPGLAFPAMIVGLVLGLVNAFKKEPSPPLILAYGLVQGVFLGGISLFFNSYWPGVAQTAVVATLAVFGVSLVAYKMRWIKVTEKFRSGMLLALGGYFVFALVSFGAAMFGVGDGWGFRTGFFGIAIGLFAVGLAALTLLLDFDFIEKGVQQGLPERYAWTAAFGLAVTLIWLYIELLRLIAILRGE
ncbi:MAG TPA: Bax inhibitor-1/YccA family protein [Jiangellales bacterium]|nr:Bax inhibitor-1/YccA family protein [Jiangellales bacterium]